MAMVDYPAPASFLEPLPAWPVNVSCSVYENVTATPSNDTLLELLFKASQVYFNSSGQQQCLDFKSDKWPGSLDAYGWNVLACNQMAQPIDGGGYDSMFIEQAYNFTYNTQYCQQKFGLTPQYNWVFDTFGGRENYREQYRVYSNIIFSNGNLDPWKAGGVTSFVSIDLPVYIIKGGAHHLDLRTPDDQTDPEDLKWVRQQESEVIGQWVTDYQHEPHIKGTQGKYNSFI